MALACGRISHLMAGPQVATTGSQIPEEMGWSIKHSDPLSPNKEGRPGSPLSSDAV